MPKIGSSLLLLIAAFTAVLSQDLVISSGPNSATTSPGDLENPQVPWAGLPSIYTRDYQPNDRGDGRNTYSTVAGLGNNQLTQRLEATDFKFDLSTFGSVAGIYVEYSRRSGGTVYDYSIELLVDGQPIPGTNRCNFTQSVCAGTVWRAGDRWGSQGYGSPTDLWGLTGILKSTVSNPTFGVGIRCVASDGNPFFNTPRDPDVDYVNVTIYGSAVTESELGLTSSDGTGSSVNSAVVPAVIAVIVVLLVIGALIGIIVLVKRRPDLFQRLKKISDDRDAKAEARRQKEAAADPYHVSSSTLTLQVIGDSPSSSSSSPTSSYAPSSSTSSPPPSRPLPPPSHMTSSSSSPPPFIPGKSTMTPSVANYAKVAKPSQPSSQCFGVDIDIVRKSGQIPIVVEECIAYLESRGLNEEGLLRLAGSTSDVSHLKDTYNEGKSPDFRKTNDINNVAGLLKLFFRELPQKPLLMTAGIKKFAQSSMSDASEGISIMRSELEALPVTNRETLKRLFLFLQRLSQNAAVNKMSPENLAIVFSPTLGLSMPLLAFMIGYADEIFV